MEEYNFYILKQLYDYVFFYRGYYILQHMIDHRIFSSLFGKLLYHLVFQLSFDNVNRILDSRNTFLVLVFLIFLPLLVRQNFVVLLFPCFLAVWYPGEKLYNVVAHNPV